MKICFLTCLLISPCCIGVALAGNLQSSEITPIVGYFKFSGFNLSIFNMQGIEVVEPILSFKDVCDSIKYNLLYLKYELTLPLIIQLNAHETPTDRSNRVDQMILTRLEATADAALASKDSKVLVLGKLTGPGDGQLIFLCETFHRCDAIKEELNINPQLLQNALNITLVGRVSDSLMAFVAIRSANLPRFSCPAGQWVVFQRRVDGSLSFAKNWDAYVKGFGNPESNYWMGLDNLFAMTVTSSTNKKTRCQLRVEAEDNAGNKYWGEYKLFQVLGPEINYRLRLDLEVSGMHVENFKYHNGMQFSTYDRDNDAYDHVSVSQNYGYGGWWYGNSGTVNLNGPYPTDNSSIEDKSTYFSIKVKEKDHVVLRSSLMKIKCG